MNIVRTGFLAGVSVIKTNLHGNTLTLLSSSYRSLQWQSLTLPMQN
jgi:hypothetical protein